MGLTTYGEINNSSRVIIDLSLSVSSLFLSLSFFSLSFFFSLYVTHIHTHAHTLVHTRLCVCVLAVVYDKVKSLTDLFVKHPDSFSRTPAIKLVSEITRTGDKPK